LSPSKKHQKAVEKKGRKQEKCGNERGKRGGRGIRTRPVPVRNHLSKERRGKEKFLT